ncbi:Nucleoside-diphosphate-sugar epimerase [Pseudonocardia thermophila]|jgi:Nucleoside-diphosphate-sugar epimerases|uniref:Nucleoside-diphosphate-sugar epimerase n=1 Tax=Pseudonocardia thermophila TaxID=1848 RepID=A0A1M6SCN4_PSETH|nr:NAD-dependent epimerase/dehydratase family protein [Pseudonocardia thermophila]SHK42426.1 Nucleoside-diphosphate-sugar epimerase [Pseudonocardia thermophila]
MRVLVLGGTRFLSRAVAVAALARGHEVVCAARGESGPAPAGAALVAVDRDQGLGPLVGQRFDAVVDVARMNVRWVRDALAGIAARHWTFVSSVSVYDAGGALLPPQEDAEPADPDGYGKVKVASEDAVRAARPDALIVRAGLICGPGDLSDRFGYWPARFARGGRAVVPDVPDQPCQIVDVRDLAEWIVRCAEDGTGGTVDGVGPRSTLGAVLDEVAAAVGAPDLERVPVAPDVLRAAGIEYWAGPRSLPLWLPPGHLGIASHDPGPAAAAGLVCRPVAETARATLEHELALGPDRDRRAGLTADDEVELLAQVPA